MADRIVLGMDEVGRGAWAGPVVVGAVVLNSDIAGLRDSKLLSRTQREKLDKEIRETALAFALGWADAREVDELGLTTSLQLAYERAFSGIHVRSGIVVIDGAYNFLPDIDDVETIVDADATVPAVSAASIIAKVARDSFMIKAAREFPGYAFDRHVGYGTVVHRDALAAHGACSLHRFSFRPVRLIARRSLLR